ncbi:MAG: Holliday junction branch migration protein RuvA [Oscillospiraceae bacterium]|nr:Holliday junction branch migration protein RuvA [Oscillospiraceae bacterium]
MFYYLSGTVAHTEPNMVVIDVGGAGYACHASLQTVSRAKTGEAMKLYTYMYVREDIFDIFGFYDTQELHCFKLLLGISGVGPKAALSVLSVTTPERLSLAIISGDDKALTAAQGVGKKLAQRIVLELKDKLAKGMSDWDGGFSAAVPTQGSKLAEAQAALVVLGYSASEAAMATRGLDAEALGLEELIKQALKRMM